MVPVICFTVGALFAFALWLSCRPYKRPELPKLGEYEHTPGPSTLIPSAYLVDPKRATRYVN